jgi:hypothetical protein
MEVVCLCLHLKSRSVVAGSEDFDSGPCCTSITFMHFQKIHVYVYILVLVGFYCIQNIHFNFAEVYEYFCKLSSYVCFYTGV